MLLAARLSITSYSSPRCASLGNKSSVLLRKAGNARGIHTSSSALNRKCGIVGTSPQGLFLSKSADNHPCLP